MNIKISEKAVLYRLNNQGSQDGNNTIGAYIRKERLAQGLKQEYVCNGICSISYYSRIERNEAIPSNLYISQIFKKLNKPIPNNLLHNHDIHYQEIINSFLMAIEYRNEKLINQEFEKLKELDVVNIELYEFVYYIYNRKIDLSLPYIQKLHSQQIYFNNEELLIYLENLGIYYNTIKEYSKSEKILTLAIKLVEKNTLNRPIILYKYAWVLGKLNYDLKSIEYAEKANHMFIQNHNTRRSVDCQLLIAIKSSKYFPYKSSKIYENLIKISNQNGYSDILKICQFNLSILLKKTNDIEEAELLFLELIKTYHSDLDFLINVYIEYIDMLLLINRHEHAKEFFKEVEEFRLNTEKYKLFTKYYSCIFRDKDLKSKLLLYKMEFIPYSKKIKNKSLQIRFRKEYALLLERDNNYSACIKELKEILRLENILCKSKL